jgi:transcriptional regulator with XRE-family HTH domain
MKDRFAANLARYRKREGMSQEELGYRASLHRTEVSLLERGARMPRADTLVRLAHSLAVSVNDLIGSIEWRPGNPKVVAGRFELSSEAPESVDGNGGSVEREPTGAGVRS